MPGAAVAPARLPDANHVLAGFAKQLARLPRPILVAGETALAGTTGVHATGAIVTAETRAKVLRVLLIMILLMQLHVVCNVVLGCMETRSVHDATAAVRVSELRMQRGLGASVSELLWRLL